MKKGDLHTVQITAYTSEGAGIARIDGMAVFIPQAIRGETCEIMILKGSLERGFEYPSIKTVVVTDGEPSSRKKKR